jgi:hypothetical protein
VTHAGTVPEFLSRYGSAGRFLRPALYGFSNRNLEQFLTDRSVPLEETDAGKLFPASRRARDVLNVLVVECRSLGIELRTGTRVRTARFAEGAFEVKTDVGAERSKTLVIATGGRSYPKTGSCGDGYALAASFGHRMAEIAPALTPVVVENFAAFAVCAGVSLPGAVVRVFRGGKKMAAGAGDVLFTHRGLSGPGILDLSRYIRVGDELRISPEKTESRFLEALSEHGKRTVARVLQDFGLPESLARAALGSLGTAPDVKAAVLDRRSRLALSRRLSGGSDGGFPFLAAALGGWEEAMATRGGVDLSEVDPKRMESRLVPGLFFAGEVLDVDGDTGGFNIQAACSTGFLAGKSV